MMVLLGVILAATPTASAQRVYEGTGVFEDGDDVDDVVVQVTVAGTAPELEIRVCIDFLSAPPFDCQPRFVYSVTLTGESYEGPGQLLPSLTIAGQLTCDAVSGSESNAGLGFTLGSFSFEATCVSGCENCPFEEEEEEEEEEEDDICAETVNSRVATLTSLWQEPGGGNFFDPDHWAIDEVPGAGFTVLFAENVVNGGTVTLNGDHTSEALVVTNDLVTLELLNATQYTLSTECASSLEIGFAPDPNPDIPTSKLTVVGEGLIDAQSVLLGGDAGTTGRLRLEFVDLTSATSCTIGGDGQGRFEVVEAAIFQGADVQIAKNASGSGFATVAGSDSTMQIDEKLVIAGLGTGSLDLVEGAKLELLDGAEVIIGQGSGSDGSMLVSDQGTTLIGKPNVRLVVGGLGTGSLDLVEGAKLDLRDGAEVIIGQGSGSDGRMLVSDQDSSMLGKPTITLGELSGSSGLLEVSGVGAVVDAGVIVVGKSGMGEIQMTDRGGMFAKQLTLAADEGSQGDVLVDGAGPDDEDTGIVVDQFTVIAETGTASLTIRNGGGVIGGTGAGEQVASSIAATLGSRGTVTVEGEGAFWGTKVLNVGFAGTGEMFIRDQGLVTSNEAVVGNTEGAIGDVEITSGGRWEIEGRLIMAAEGSIGRIQVSGESFLIADEIVVGPLAVLTGNFILIGPDGEGTPISLRLQSQDLETPGIFTNRMVIEQGGIIEADQITLGPGGELAGDGDLDVDLLNTGTLSPGLDECTTGLFSINGNYTQDSTATLRIKLGGQTLGDTHDSLSVNGVAELAGELHIDAINDFVPQPGDSFEILTADSVSGAFDSIEGSGEYEAVYENNRVLLTVRVTPTEVAATCGEPGEVITQPNLCGAGLCGSGMVPIAPLMVCGLGLLRLTTSRRPRQLTR